MKVSAIDALSGVEASIVGDAKSPPELLKRTALRKLIYVLNKNRPSEPSSGGGRGGTLV